jgi:hypothetical protein
MQFAFIILIMSQDKPVLEHAFIEEEHEYHRQHDVQEEELCRDEEERCLVRRANQN